MSARQSAATDEALKLIVAQSLTPYAAARKVGISLTTIYRALDRHPDVKKLVQDRRSR